MQINRDNYEVFLVDHLDGTLSQELTQELFAFLAANKDLQEELNLLQSENNQAVFFEPKLEIDFGFLKKEDTMAVDEELMVAALEGDLSKEDVLSFERNLELYPALKKEYALFQLTKLPKVTVEFFGKNQLKKKLGFVIPLYVKLGSIAAVLLAFIFIGLLYKGTNTMQESTSGLVSNEPKVMENPSSIDKIKTKIETPNFDLVQTKNRIKEKPLVQTKTIEKSIEKVIEINAKEAPSLPLKLNDFEPNLLAKVEAKNKSALPELASSNAEFLKPGEWLLEKVKKQLPSETLAYTDSIRTGGTVTAGEIALNLVQRTTGISYHDKRDTQNGTRGFAIVSKYFAYERITHP
ncbi:MAG: hypothetical protein K9H61_03445 [Bacteroidia bacterium]|nr:hypothetical protein [Bacteroidia bacterium]MCF8427789.1 hypothetical protein [Bacteroidia bacterium]MCF8446027.1 hypothetical protein [Bacteroidia bacterium]